MNTLIEIRDIDFNESGCYHVTYWHNGQIRCRKIDDNHVNALLNMRQKEDFFMGKYRFRVQSEYDFNTIVLQGLKRQGL